MNLCETCKQPESCTENEKCFAESARGFAPVGHRFSANTYVGPDTETAKRMAAANGIEVTDYAH